MVNLLQLSIITRQLFGELPTHCLKCKKQKSFKIIDDFGSYTILCDCGCRIIKYHAPDPHHETAFFLENFISKKDYRENFKEKSELEKMGFIKHQENGKTIFTK